MGQEAVCRVEYEGRVAEGKALRETDELVFRAPGELRLKIPYREMSSVSASDGEMTVVWPEGKAVFHLGAQAEPWAERIRNPRTLTDKLGVKPGSRVSILGVEDANFVKLLDQRTDDVTIGRAAKGSDLIFYEADSARDLARLRRLEPAIDRAGAVWVVSPRGDPSIQDVHVIAAAKEAGLVDVKVVRFSGTHTAIKLVIPVARR